MKSQIRSLPESSFHRPLGFINSKRTKKKVRTFHFLTTGHCSHRQKYPACCELSCKPEYFTLKSPGPFRTFQCPIPNQLTQAPEKPISILKKDTK